MTGRTSPPRGIALLEVMIAMGVLAVGLLAMWHMHVFGIASTSAGRRHTVAMTLARDLVTGLERLPFADPLLTVTGTSGLTPPTPFGPLVDAAGGIATGAHENAQDVPGVHPGPRAFSEAFAGYTRRWTVWGYSQTAGAPPATKIIAVSVTWSDRPFPRPHEVVLYTQVHNLGAIFQNLGANQ